MASIILKALGLNKQPNFLDPMSCPPGSMLVASDVVIRRDGIVEPRRGYPLYGNALGTSSDRAKQLATYKNTILRHYSNKLQWDTGLLNTSSQSIFNTFDGNYLEPSSGRRIRHIESNGNFYFTSDQGIKKISATSMSDFTTTPGFITQAGGIKALDLTSSLSISLGSSSGFLPQDSSVAYRIVWGTNDKNKNEILGTPSQRSVIYNPLLNLLLQDFDRLIQSLDNVSNNSSHASLISNGDYFSQYNLPISSSATSLRTNLISVATELDSDIQYADQASVAPLQITSAAISGGVCTVTFSSGDPRNYLVAGNKIKLSGFSPGTSGTLNGAQVVATTTATTLTFTTSATGTVTLSSATINSNMYESIAQPTVPTIPTTNSQLVSIQTYLQAIITQLQSEPSTGTTPVISSNSQSTFIGTLGVTTTSNVLLKITIPNTATVNNFFQVYRTDTALATGTQVLATDIFPNDELKLVYEAFPTSNDISNGYVLVTDITPPEFAGEFLYTNATTGQGILQSNDRPPFALDINKFKNVAFYSNTKTLYSQLINLLGVVKMIADYNGGTAPKLTVTDGVTTHTYKFVTGLQETTQFTTVADSSGSLAGKYFTFNNANDVIQYYGYYVVSGVGSDPAISGKIAVPIYINTNETANNVAVKSAHAIASLNRDFTCSSSTNTFTIVNVNFGPATDGTVGTSGFSINVTQQGRGEDPTTQQVLLSTNVSPSLAVDETARSLVHVINEQSTGIINAFYLSDAQSVPGQMQFEARSLGQSAFYILGNNTNTGASFNPDISPAFTISANSLANPTVVTTSSPHGLTNQDKVVICGSNSTPSIDGLYSITYISTTTFSIPVNVTIAGTTGSLKAATTTLTADNLVKPHRIYFSKLLQPEAVPATNYIDVGAQDKAILRIFPLRDSLFVYKEDGLYRISGEVAPFNDALFDLSCVLIAPDSLDSSNNLIYSWTTQGITSTSESGVNIISRPIDTDILPLATPQYANFSTATWGIGYESDNSYTVYTIQNTSDTVATRAWRYSTLTNTWTNFEKTATCGVINSVDGKQYLGSGNTNFIEQERKNFDRTDYADRQYLQNLHAGNVSNNILSIENATVISVGDVVTQDQYLSVYNYNNILSKLDSDLTMDHTYTTNLTMFSGDDPRVKLDALLAKISIDSTRLAQAGALAGSNYTQYQTVASTLTINSISASNPAIIATSSTHGLTTGRQITISGSNSTPSIDGIYQVTVLSSTTFSIPVSVKISGTSGTALVNNGNFLDIQSSFNGMVAKLNSDPGVAFGNYQTIDSVTTQEAIITQIDTHLKKITLNLSLPFIVGTITLFNSIPSVIQYTPQDMQDPLNVKHFSESTLMFEDKGFTSGTLEFSSDIIPSFQSINVLGTGTGIFGSSNFGYNYFGGVTNSIPFRTYVPRDMQRCRFLNVKFSHSTAREKFSLQGVTLTGNNTNSSKGYR